MVAPPKSQVFTNVLEKPKENNEFDYYSIKNQLKNELWSFRRGLYQI